MAALALLVVALAGPTAFAETTKRFPPYPDVWGRSLPLPDGDRSVSTSNYMAPDGDLLIIGHRGERETATNPLRYFKAWFFKGGFQYITRKEAKTYDHRITLPSGEESWGSKDGRYFHKLWAEKITIANGRTVETKQLLWSKCPSLPNTRMILRDRNGRVLANKMLFLLYDQPVRKIVNPNCEITFDIRSDYMLKRFAIIRGSLMPLEDGTFVGYIGRKFVRFDSDLRSTYVDNRRLFIVDWKAIDAITEQTIDKTVALEVPLIQTVEDAIHAYLLTLKRKD